MKKEDLISVRKFSNTFRFNNYLCAINDDDLFEKTPAWSLSTWTGVKEHGGERESLPWICKLRLHSDNLKGVSMTNARLPLFFYCENAISKEQHSHQYVFWSQHHYFWPEGLGRVRSMHHLVEFWEKCMVAIMCYINLLLMSKYLLIC